jgi:hypothetical protein
MLKRLLFYVVAFIVGFLVFVPVPFAPSAVHKFVSGFGIPLAFVTVFVLGVFAIGLLVYHFKRDTISNLLLIEAVCVPLLFLILRLGLQPPLTEARYSAIVDINRGKPIEEFVNPFLGLVMMDCREVSKTMDVIFIPEHLAPDTHYLEYAPKKDLVHDSGPIRKSYGDDWYQTIASSQWYGTELGDCASKYGLGIDPR